MKHLVSKLIIISMTAASSIAIANCRTSMSYLSNRLPAVGNSEILSIRQQILETDLNETMRQASQQGFSPESAVRATLQQAREFDKSTAEALQTASATDAFGTTDEQFLQALRSGKLNINRCDGIRDSSLCSAAITKLGAIANRAIAAELECHARAGTWAR